MGIADRQGAREKARKRRRWLWGASGLLIAIGVVGVLIRQHREDRVTLEGVGQTELDDVFKDLSKSGYWPNRTLAGHLIPGTIIQTRESDGKGIERELKPPVVMFWSNRCFPDLVIQSASFGVRNHAGKSSSSLSLNANGIRLMFPSLAIQSDAVADFAMTIADTRLQVAAKGDLSGQFSPECVQSLAAQVEAGMKPEWFSVVIEAVKAGKLSYHVNWSTTSSAKARLHVQSQLESVLGQAGSSPDGGVLAADLDRAAKTDTVLEVSDVALAYRARPLEPLHDVAGVPRK